MACPDVVILPDAVILPDVMILRWPFSFVPVSGPGRCIREPWAKHDGMISHLIE